MTPIVLFLFTSCYSDWDKMAQIRLICLSSHINSIISVVSRLLLYRLCSTRTCSSLQCHSCNAEMAVMAVIPPVPKNQPVTGFRVLARHRPPLQQASAAGHPSPCCPDPAGRCSLADGTHGLDLLMSSYLVVRTWTVSFTWCWSPLCVCVKALVWRWQCSTRAWARSTHILRT